jgi:pyruvate,water dikinase
MRETGKEDAMDKTATHETVAPGARTGLKPPAPFAKPRPGRWTLDASHCERPLPRFAHDVFGEPFSRGFRDSMAVYGALLETIEVEVVNGFLYTCPRPYGAPPEAKGTPPKPIFKLMLALHPGMRKRIRRAEAVWTEKPWREETRRYLSEWMPGVEREAARLKAAPLAALDDAALSRHLEDCHRHLLDGTYVHHRMNGTRVVPVGDFVVHASRWTGARATEVLEAMRGCSPHSREGFAELEALARSVQSDAAVLGRVLEGRDPEEIVAGLESRQDAIGEAARAWLGAVGHLVTGFSPGYPTLRETPATLVESLRGFLRGSGNSPAAEAGRAALERLRGRVPAEHREAFDALLAEARHVYFIRDHSCMRGTASFGVARLALLEAGRRLAERGLVSEPEAALDASLADLKALLTSGAGPSREELDARLAWRRHATAELAPEALGPEAGTPPPAEWLPVGAARLFRAIDAYIRGMFEEAGAGDPQAAVVRGLGASGGKRVGTARLVLAPGDFDRVCQGDVLVTRITTPTYNILLPLLAGIVTDRGGILSHPAIVSREFGIPGVVGTRNATAAIPDGATVEIDGDAGTVRVLR